ncbi:MAG: terminase small subunit [Pseudomonadota bacterium]|nr:terminase small subunit [Pseudomonadota bacterium]
MAVPKKTTEKRYETFVDEYLRTLDGPHAYRKAGYKGRSPGVVWTGVSWLLRNPKVQALMAARRAAIERRTEISQDRVRLELGRIGFFDPRRLFDETGQFIEVPKLPEEVAAAISSIEVTEIQDGKRNGHRGPARVTKIRLCSKVEALDKLCRHLGMYEDKVRIVGLEREISTLPDEELEERIIELGRGEYRRVADAEARSAAAAAPALPAAAGKEPPR